MRETINHKITVATLNGKSYYKIINTLKLLQLNYEELSPLEALNSYSRIIITSKGRIAYIQEKKYNGGFRIK